MTSKTGVLFFLICSELYWVTDPFLVCLLIQRWHHDTGPGCPQGRELAVTQTLLINFVSFAWKMSVSCNLVIVKTLRWFVLKLSSKFLAGEPQSCGHLNSRKAISDRHYTVTTWIIPSQCGSFTQTPLYHTRGICLRLYCQALGTLSRFSCFHQMSMSNLSILIISKPVRIEMETGSARSLQPGLLEQIVPTSGVRSRSGHSVRKLSGSVNLIKASLLWAWQ